MARAWARRSEHLTRQSWRLCCAFFVESEPEFVKNRVRVPCEPVPLSAALESGRAGLVVIGVYNGCRMATETAQMHHAASYLHCRAFSWRAPLISCTPALGSKFNPENVFALQHSTIVMVSQAHAARALIMYFGSHVASCLIRII